MNPMSDEDSPRKSFEDALRAIGEEVTRAVDRLSEMDLDDVARSVGIDPEQARGWIDDAGSWLREQADSFDPSAFDAAGFRASWSSSSAPADPVVDEVDPLGDAGPHPLDLPTAQQGRALAALDSGRWTIEPGTSALAARGEGPAPQDALGLVRELRVRDWLDQDGHLTLAGRAALARWLDAA
jgi:hypothetical protein